MEDDLYGFLNDFPFCENKIQEIHNIADRKIYHTFCFRIAKKFNFNDEVKTNFINDMCPQALSYLFDINIKGGYSKYKKAGCRFFHYWLYYLLKKYNYCNYTNDIYNDMLSYHPTALGTPTFCTDYSKKATYEELEDLRAIYNSYKCLKKINKVNVSDNYTKYCDSLIKIIDENQKPVVHKVFPQANSQISSPEENNTQEIPRSSRSNIYTPYGSLLRHKIKRIRIKLDNITNTRNVLKPTEVPINILNSSMYDMLYN
ncbi:variable surface protein [Plasmodium gonderi]|uniref:Variable surface protein n=1 Tax=Plasmodium gonderi TaxID=77519 RepID=A0A1Y1JPH4_PLAGO|nr:variable surface protein [Plasmodium gonderi]GAW84516.1 variable surface protein [Plasmodium gonderi]